MRAGCSIFQRGNSPSTSASSKGFVDRELRIVRSVGSKIKRQQKTLGRSCDAIATACLPQDYKPGEAFAVFGGVVGGFVLAWSSTILSGNGYQGLFSVIPFVAQVGGLLVLHIHRVDF